MTDSQRVRRAALENVILSNRDDQEICGSLDFTSQHPNVAVLPINPDTGAVGPVEPIQATNFNVMLNWLDGLEDADVGMVPFSVITLHDLATALQQILGGQDEQR